MFDHRAAGRERRVGQRRDEDGQRLGKMSRRENKRWR